MPLSLLIHFLGAQLRDGWVRFALSVLTVAAGVGLGVAVYTINGSAVAEMSRATREMAGAADVQMTAGGRGMPEALLVKVLGSAFVREASPIVEHDVFVRRGGASEAQERRIVKLIGVDALRAASVNPALLGDVAVGSNYARVNDRAAFLNPAAEALLGAQSGESFELAGQLWTMAGRLNQVPLRDPVVVVDIAAAQDAFDGAGRLSRIDVRLRRGATLNDLRADLGDLPVGVVLAMPEAAGTRADRLSRSYRTNLAVLALVSLFTGGFLVLSSQALAVARRSRELALLGVLGLAARERLTLMLTQGALVGVTGSLLGVGLGLVTAKLVLSQRGGDLGAGLLPSAATLAINVPMLMAIGTLGLAAALLGAYAPSRALMKQPLAPLLRERETDLALARARPTSGVAFVCAAAGLCTLPAVGGVPWFGYAAIAALLAGAVFLLPTLVAGVLGRLPPTQSPTLALAIAQAKQQPGMLVAGLAGVVVSVALASSMLTMVTSFRTSLIYWLDHVISAPVYVQLNRHQDSADHSPLKRRLAALPGVSSIEWMHFERLPLHPDLPSPTLMARDMDGRAAKAIGVDTHEPPREKAHLPRMWVAEAMVDLYDMKPGSVVALPIASARAGDRAPQFVVSGVYRDYARQFGSVVVDRAIYAQVSGNFRAASGAIYLVGGADARATKAAVLALTVAPDDVDVTLRETIRDLSLAIFDRTFAITYGLQLAAIVIAVVGVASGFAAVAYARRREFGMLLHLGFTRGDLRALLAYEGLTMAMVAVAVGVVTGLGIALILIEVVNRQSFHWGMDYTIAPGDLLVMAAGVVGFCASAAALVGSRALADDAVRLVRADE